ncbi:hypothetical protein FKL55_18195 [Klebsiella pneumoniae]|nr:hypothetical protein [Klebsiella pneumoniae]
MTVVSNPGGRSIGSAHGRGTNPPSVIVAEARLVVNAAHTIVIFVMELIHATKI